MKPVLILKTGQTVSTIPPAKGDFENWIMAAMGLPKEGVHTVAVYLDEALPDPALFSGVVITGSPAMVTDSLEWISRSEQFLRSFIALARPVLGICFGHQLLAKTLGGTVDWHPKGREIGTTSVTLTEHAATDLLFVGLPESFPVHVSHMQSILTLPANSRILASNDFDPHHGVRFAEQVWGMQFHPEFDETIMRCYINERRSQLMEEGFEPETLLNEVSPAPDSYSLLRTFARICRKLPFAQMV